jgi:hypothetical protein
MTTKALYEGPFTIRIVRARRGSDSDVRDVPMKIADFGNAMRQAETIAADFYDGEDYTVNVYVLDALVTPVYRAKGERPPERERRHAKLEQPQERPARDHIAARQRINSFARAKQGA